MLFNLKYTREFERKFSPAFRQRTKFSFAAVQRLKQPKSLTAKTILYSSREVDSLGPDNLRGCERCGHEWQMLRTRALSLCSLAPVATTARS
eukprot:scaffold405_cov243-Pinguiococcus_pyrenoidosus.AAC.14